MPYVDQERRHAIRKGKLPIFQWEPGDLNFWLTEVVNDYLGTRPSYSEYNEVIGVLECAKLELYRRRIASYEDEKIAQNGDVYLSG